MATTYNTMMCLWGIFMLVATYETKKYCCVDGIPTVNENHFEPKRKGTLKTIKADGYLIDCVDIYKQPGLDNPSDLQIVASIILSKIDFIRIQQTCNKVYNHKSPKLFGKINTMVARDTLPDSSFEELGRLFSRFLDFRMDPSLQFKSELNKTNNLLFDKIDLRQPKAFQNWQKYGKCPKGTIPIRKNWNTNGTIFPNNRPEIHEYAISEQNIEGLYHGGGATYSVWNPHVTGANEFSLAQLWVTTGSDLSTESIEAGWIVYPYKHGGDTRTIFFIFWTADGYQNVCWNLECGDRGFQQTNENTCIGCPIAPSQYGGNIEQIRFVVWRDRITGHWWLYVNAQKIGYFPRQLFRNLNGGADRVQFGGEVGYFRGQRERHTSTQMGSGRFPAEGFKKASFVHSANVVNQRGEIIHATLASLATNPGCYNVLPGRDGTRFGSYFFFGGPGYSRDKCP